MSSRSRIAAFALIAAAVIGTGFSAYVPSAEAARKAEKRTAVTLEEARKIALKRVPGEVQDEYTLEDDDGNVTAYVFVIKDKKKKVWEVQIGAEKGDVQSVEEQESDDEDTDDPPAEDPPMNGLRADF